MAENPFRDRKYVVIGIFIVGFIIFVIKLAQLQLIDDSYKNLADQHYKRRITVYPDRGLIYDRTGKLLVVNDPIYDIYVAPSKLNELDTILLCQILKIELADFDELLLKARKGTIAGQGSALFHSKVSVEDHARFQEHLRKFPGFFGQVRSIRSYPYNSAAHVLGYMGEVNDRDIERDSYYKSRDEIGKTGVEKTYEPLMRGERGCRYITQDRFNQEMGSYLDGKFDTAAVSGKDVTLTIDIELQNYGELLMQNKKGSVVAIEPSTGEILALISSPTYDPNLLTGSKERSKNYSALYRDSLYPLFNRAIMSEYPPGSTFKPLMALIGLQEGTLKVGSSYKCLPGYRNGNRIVGCHAHKRAANLSEAIMHSCNAYFCFAFKHVIENDKYEGSKEGLEQWRNYLISFGLGNKLGIDIPNEEAGLIPSTSLYDKLYGDRRWKASNIISLSIGQGELGLTPLQMANMTAIIANRGYYYAPHLIKKIEDDDNEIPLEFRTKHKTLIDQQYFEPIVDGLHETVIQGTGKIAQIEGYEVCGKTGTAQNPHGEDHSVFVTFAPKDDPKIVIVAFVENSGFGSTYAAPISSLMMEKYLNRTITEKRKRLEERMINADLIHLEEGDKPEEG